MTHVYQFSGVRRAYVGPVPQILADVERRSEEDSIAAAQAALQILLTNRDDVHLRTEQFFNDQRRRAAQNCRHLHRTEELADLADTKVELKCMKERRRSLFSVLPDFRSPRTIRE